MSIQKRLDDVANSLEVSGNARLAKVLDTVSNTLDKLAEDHNIELGDLGERYNKALNQDERHELMERMKDLIFDSKNDGSLDLLMQQVFRDNMKELVSELSQIPGFFEALNRSMLNPLMAKASYHGGRHKDPTIWRALISSPLVRSKLTFNRQFEKAAEYFPEMLPLLVSFDDFHDYVMNDGPYKGFGDKHIKAAEEANVSPQIINKLKQSPNYKPEETDGGA